MMDTQPRASQELAVMAMHLGELDGVPTARPDDPEAVNVRSNQLAADLVEPAKADALDKLGEGRQALRIAAGWVRAKLA